MWNGALREGGNQMCRKDPYLGHVYEAISSDGVNLALRSTSATSF
jgi:hypothetical protein